MKEQSKTKASSRRSIRFFTLLQCQRDPPLPIDPTGDDSQNSLDPHQHSSMSSCHQKSSNDLERSLIEPSPNSELEQCSMELMIMEIENQKKQVQNQGKKEKEKKKKRVKIGSRMKSRMIMQEQPIEQSSIKIPKKQRQKNKNQNKIKNNDAMVNFMRSFVNCVVGWKDRFFGLWMEDVEKDKEWKNFKLRLERSLKRGKYNLSHLHSLLTYPKTHPNQLQLTNFLLTCLKQFLLNYASIVKKNPKMQQHTQNDNISVIQRVSGSLANFRYNGLRFNQCTRLMERDLSGGHIDEERNGELGGLDE